MNFSKSQLYKLCLCDLQGHVLKIYLIDFICSYLSKKNEMN